ncbi:unnamed protein product [Calicophoron daubneyi]|uniref:N-acetylgalactosaminide beta-1,3-galactosyltransferase n=1 Tax=Calicophoron daubneyi TaxID=300641 RepID=A0AAV2TJ66_CALDB
MYCKPGAVLLGMGSAQLILMTLLFNSPLRVHNTCHPPESVEKEIKFPLKIYSVMSRNKRFNILCYINTYSENHKTKAIHVKNTWARRCSYHFFTSATDHPDLHIMKINMSVPETHMHLWVKMRAVLRMLYKLADKYDYFYKADDDTYAIYENLEKRLRTYSPAEPFMTGWNHHSSAYLPFFLQNISQTYSTYCTHDKHGVYAGLHKKRNCKSWCDWSRRLET